MSLDNAAGRNEPQSQARLLPALMQPRWFMLAAAIAWIALMAHVMIPGRGELWRNAILAPAIPAILFLYIAIIRRLRGNVMAMAGASLVFFWLLVAACVPWLPLVDPNRPIAPFALPGSVHSDHLFLLGADLKGRDMLSRVLWGSQRILVWGVSATAVAYVFGTVMGLLAGYLGGRWDNLLSFLANIALSFPVMVLFILILNVLGPGGFNIVIAVTFASAPPIMRIVRSLVLDIRSRDYVLAAQTRGEPLAWILFVEILPNVRGPLIVDACLRLGYTTVAITTLTFLGLGLQPPDPDWGLMISEAAHVAVLWKFAYMILIPAAAVSSLILGFNLLADSINDERGHG